MVLPVVVSAVDFEEPVTVANVAVAHAAAAFVVMWASAAEPRRSHQAAEVSSAGHTGHMPADAQLKHRAGQVCLGGSLEGSQQMKASAAALAHFPAEVYHSVAMHRMDLACLVVAASSWIALPLLAQFSFAVLPVAVPSVAVPGVACQVAHPGSYPVEDQLGAQLTTGSSHYFVQQV